MSLHTFPGHELPPLEPSAGDGDGGWLISFADILMLLLTLFVLLLAFHTVRPAASEAAPRETLAVQPAARSSAPPSTSPKAAALMSLSESVATHGLLLALQDEAPPRPQPGPASAAAIAVAALSEPAATGALLHALREDEPAVQAPEREPIAAAPPALEIPDEVRARVEVAASADAVNLIIKDEVLFDLASADLKPQAYGILDDLVAILGRNGYSVSVEGHTDDKPIHTARYPSNWDLSVARATRVTRYLIEHGIARERLRAVGYADTKPLAAGDTPQARARNRRVSLVVHLREPRAEPLPQHAARSAVVRDDG